MKNLKQLVLGLTILLIIIFAMYRCDDSITSAYTGVRMIDHSL